MKRLPFTQSSRPKENDVIILCTTDGKILCGVVNYYKDDYDDIDKLSVSMFINDTETDASIALTDVRWWHLFPLTKEELYTGTALL